MSSSSLLAQTLERTSVLRASSRPSELSAVEVARAVQSRELSCFDVARDCLDRVHELDEAIGAWVHLDPEVALAQARGIDAKIASGDPLGPLVGVPVGVKDIFNTAQMPTQMGSPIWAGFTPGNDARVVAQLRAADAFFLGKTVTAEFAVHTPGPTRNPHDPAHMVPLALGTQTAGSIIRPASYCGVYGFKPSFGLVARTGMLKTTDSLDTVGAFARTIDDLAVAFEIMRVRGRDYPVAHAALGDASRQNKGARPWRIGVVENPPQWDHAEPYAREALAAYVRRLERVQGLEIVRVRLPEPFFRAHEVHATIYDKALSYYFKNEFEQRTLISPIMYDIVQRGRAITLDDYKNALAEQSALAATFDEQIQSCDAWLTLSTGGAALAGLDSIDRLDSCLVWTLCGAPTVNLPVFTKEHLPFGAQLVARKYNDYLLFGLLRFLEANDFVGAAPHPRPELVSGS